jgi:ElaB/YqjD/DUF883 family membrane-anchored ribosome-binding protein
MMTNLREARLRRDLNNVASQVESLMSRLGDEGLDRMSEWRDRMSSMASTLGSGARERLSSLDSSVRSGARQAADFTDGYVHENPWRAIGVGAAIGLLIGYLVSRR